MHNINPNRCSHTTKLMYVVVYRLVKVATGQFDPRPPVKIPSNLTVGNIQRGHLDSHGWILLQKN